MDLRKTSHKWGQMTSASDEFDKQRSYQIHGYEQETEENNHGFVAVLLRLPWV
jgi:hypothetical protein